MGDPTPTSPPEPSGSSEPKPSDAGATTTRTPPKQSIKELASTWFHGYLEEHPSKKAVYTWFRKEGKGVKSGWVLFTVAALGLMAFTGYGVNWVNQKLQDSAMSATNGM